MDYYSSHKTNQNIKISKDVEILLRVAIEASIRLVEHQYEANLTFLLDFVSLKKSIMSEECWLFTLKMIKPASLQVILSKHFDCSKAKIFNFSAWRPKLIKKKDHFIFSNSKSALSFLIFGL